jgi:hypothetical protein
MTPLIRHRSRRAWFIPVRRPEGGERRRRWAWVVLAVAAGYLLFSHGCHGDEDNELLTGSRRVAAVDGQRGSAP